jgi:hypothetical protein
MFGNKVERKRKRMLNDPVNPATAACLVTVLSAQTGQPRGTAWAIVLKESFCLAEDARKSWLTSRSPHSTLVLVRQEYDTIGVVHEVREDTAAITPMRFSDENEATNWLVGLLQAFEESEGFEFPRRSQWIKNSMVPFEPPEPVLRKLDEGRRDTPRAE